MSVVTTAESNCWITPEESYRRWLKFLDRSDHLFKTGFEAHDKAVGCFQRGALYLVGARPGVGKTAWLIALAALQARQGIKVHYLNLEMSVEEMWCRLYCLYEKSSNLRRIMERQISDTEVAAVLNAAPYLVKISPYWLEDTDFGNFVKLTRDTIERDSPAILLVDYLGLFTMRGLGPGDNYALISEVAKQLKILARWLNIPIIAAAQLNREVEKRKSARPMLADFRGSGELENHAHGVFGLWRDTQDKLEIATLKNRNGPLNDYDLEFDAPRAAVKDWDV